jgi:hypothetical protein
VLLPEHTYEQVCRQLLAEGSGEIDVGRLVEDAMAEYDADDPLLASCQTANGRMSEPRCRETARLFGSSQERHADWPIATGRNL